MSEDKNKKVTPLRPNTLVEPTVKEEAHVEPMPIQVAPANQFLDLMTTIEADVAENFNQKVDADDNYLMVQFKIDDDDNAGQVFIKGVKVAKGQHDEGLIILELMSRSEYEQILNGEIPGAEVITYSGLKSVLQQVGEQLDLAHSQLIVEVGEDIGALPIVSGPLSIEKDNFTAAIPQTVVYQPGNDDDETSPKVLYIQI